MKICMVGSAMVDLVARVPRLPVAGETLVGSSFARGFGGKGSNQAVMAARLGAEVTVVVKLGKDSFGEDTLRNYQEQGINTDFVTFTGAKSSGVAPITVDEASGQNIVIVVPGANDDLSVEDVRAAETAITASDVVICQLETPIAATLEAFQIAREHCVTTILNPAPACDLPDTIWTLTDVFIPNETEATLLSGSEVKSLEDASRAAATFLAKGCGNVIITLGEKGTVFTSGETTKHVSAPVVKAVDTTGAGDAFVGSLAYCLARGDSLADAVNRANQIASQSVLKEGTQTSYPYREQVSTILDE